MLKFSTSLYRYVHTFTFYQQRHTLISKRVYLQTLATLAADPLASLISTAWVGRIGAVELAGVGVALSVYGAFTKLLNMPVLAVVTGTTATALGASGGCTRSEGVARAVTSSLILALCVGLLQCVLVLGLGIKGLAIWGAGADTIMYDPAKSYLLVRALGLPAGVLMLSLQGAFRGLGDARTPLLITIVCNVVNVVLEPTLIFGLNLGVAGAALAVVSAQAVSVGLLVYLLSKKIDFKRHVGAAHASLTDTVKFVKPTALLAARTASITAVYAIATGLVARTDANHAAAHQVAFQLWLASSLLADSLAVAAQALLARWLADDDAHVGASAGRGKLIVERVNQLALWLGIALALGLTVGTEVLHLPKLFSKDAEVLSVLGVLMPIVIATQPINALAFTLDGVAYGVGAFSYAAKAMIVAAIPAVGIMYAGFKLAAGSVDYQIFAVWAGLAAVMVGRVLTFAVPLFKFKHPFEMLKTS